MVAVLVVVLSLSMKLVNAPLARVVTRATGMVDMVAATVAVVDDK
jgi:hypothetical protein